MVNERQFVGFKVKNSNQHTALQLCHADKMEFGKPLVKLYEIHMVALQTEITSQLQHAFYHDALIEHGGNGSHYYLKHVERGHVCIYGMDFLIFDMVKPYIEECIAKLKP